MRVGTSGIDLVSSSGKEDHPHACGDKILRLKHSLIELGSSPCVWGQEMQMLAETVSCGIIPMRVGTRHNLNPRNNADRDHPHACGDKQTGNFDMPVIQGSSPCVWGQGKLKKEAQTLGRIIPMRVGTRQGHLYPNRLSKDHPHACGDKSARISGCVR